MRRWGLHQYSYIHNAGAAAETAAAAAAEVVVVSIAGVVQQQSQHQYQPRGPGCIRVWVSGHGQVGMGGFGCALHCAWSPQNFNSEGGNGSVTRSGIEPATLPQPGHETPARTMSYPAIAQWADRLKVALGTVNLTL